MNEWLQNTLGIGPGVQARLLSSVLTIALLGALRWVGFAVVRRRVADTRGRYRWRKTITYVTAVLGLVLVGRIWLPGLRGITTFLGLVSAGLAIALKDLVANIAGWAFILWRRPFKVGDRIQIGSHRGDVIDVRLFQFTLLEMGNWVQADQTTGQMIHVPNGRVLTDVVANASKGFPFVWDEIPVLVTFESDWHKAKTLLGAILELHVTEAAHEAERVIGGVAGDFLLAGQRVAPVVYTNLADSGVLLTLRYLSHVRERRATREVLCEEVLHEFARHEDIDFAYPTTRFYDNVAEGKPGARAGPRD